MNKRFFVSLLMVALLAAFIMPVGAQDAVELRITWYDDGNEGEVLRDLLDRFEADNPDISVVIDTVAYNVILEQLPIQLQAGEGPDMARVTDLGGLSANYLDISELVEDADFWRENFGGTLDWLRPADDDGDGVYGMMTQLTITGPYVNATLFEQAGVELPGEGATWDDWVTASTEVAEATGTPYAVAIDRTGHRAAGPAISLGAQYFNEEGSIDISADEGFRSMAEMIVGWHEAGITPQEVWAGAGGSYAAANDEFVNATVVTYMSGSWQVGQFNERIGDAFDWIAIPNPCGPQACTGMPGGAALVGVADTEHPEEVARVMDYLAQTEVYAEFAARTLFIPAHAGAAASGIEFETDSESAAAALAVFTDQVGVLDPIAFQLQGYPFNRIIFDATRDRLTQVIVGELTMDEAIERIQSDFDDAMAEAS
ncbi:MAG: ABC transporter substrate-binding protein [Chloroflexota bacterium]